MSRPPRGSAPSGPDRQRALCLCSTKHQRRKSVHFKKKRKTGALAKMLAGNGPYFICMREPASLSAAGPRWATRPLRRASIICSVPGVLDGGSNKVCDGRVSALNRGGDKKEKVTRSVVMDVGEKRATARSQRDALVCGCESHAGPVPRARRGGGISSLARLLAAPS